MRAWIVKWNSSESIEKPFITLLSARKSPEQVGLFLEQLYAVEAYDPQEKFDMARYSKPRENPYPAEFPSRLSNYFNFITCGHNPWLEAIRTDVDLTTNESGDQILKYRGAHNAGNDNNDEPRWKTMTLET